MGGEEEYLAVSGKIRREPDEEAAKLVCQDTSGELCGVNMSNILTCL